MMLEKVSDAWRLYRHHDTRDLEHRLDVDLEEHRVGDEGAALRLIDPDAHSVGERYERLVGGIAVALGADCGDHVVDGASRPAGIEINHPTVVESVRAGNSNPGPVAWGHAGE